MRFETFRKRGKNWQYLGLRTAESSRGAALNTSYAQNIKVIGVRPEDSRDKIQVFRFKHVASLQSGS